MSDETPPQAMGGCLAAFLALIGVIMLLPGACAVIGLGILATEPSRALKDPVSLFMLLLLLAIGVGGAFLVRFASRQWGPR